MVHISLHKITRALRTWHTEKTCPECQGRVICPHTGLRCDPSPFDDRCRSCADSIYPGLTGCDMCSGTGKIKNEDIVRICVELEQIAKE